MDYEYERKGTASVFLFVEPLAAFRQATEARMNVKQSGSACAAFVAAAEARVGAKAAPSHSAGRDFLARGGTRSLGRCMASPPSAPPTSSNTGTPPGTTSHWQPDPHQLPDAPNRLLKHGPLLSRDLVKVMMAARCELSRLVILIVRRENVCAPADAYACMSFNFARFV